MLPRVLVMVDSVAAEGEGVESGKRLRGRKRW